MQQQESNKCFNDVMKLVFSYISITSIFGMTGESENILKRLRNGIFKLYQYNNDLLDFFVETFGLQLGKDGWLDKCDVDPLFFTSFSIELVWYFIDVCRDYLVLDISQMSKLFGVNIFFINKFIWIFEILMDKLLDNNNANKNECLTKLKLLYDSPKLHYIPMIIYVNGFYSVFSDYCETNSDKYIEVALAKLRTGYQEYKQVRDSMGLTKEKLDYYRNFAINVYERKQDKNKLITYLENIYCLYTFVLVLPADNLTLKEIYENLICFNGQGLIPGVDIRESEVLHKRFNVSIEFGKIYTYPGDGKRKCFQLYEELYGFIDKLYSTVVELNKFNVCNDIYALIMMIKKTNNKQYQELIDKIIPSQ